jgi:hypothetical protein
MSTLLRFAVILAPYVTGPGVNDQTKSNPGPVREYGLVESAQKLNQHIQLAIGDPIHAGHEFLLTLESRNDLMVGYGGGIGYLLPEPVRGTASLPLSSEIGTHLARQV